MKIKELKHNHSLTDLLKVLLFSILMLAPILAIGVKCAYVVINKNAKDSYYGETINQQQIEVVDFDNLKINNDYELTILQNTDDTVVQTTFNTLNVQVDGTKYDDVTQIRIYKTSVLYATGIVNGTQRYYWISSNLINFTFNGYVDGNQGNGYNYATFREITYNKNSYLDNVFYFAINEVAQEPLFNWTQNTAIYTGVNAMCTGMEITSPIIPILITYWFLLTCIYVIIDILIKGFTMLTHLIGSKIA